MPVGVSLGRRSSSHFAICLFRRDFDFEGPDYFVLGLVPIRAIGMCILGLFSSHALRILRNDKMILGSRRISLGQQ